MPFCPKCRYEYRPDIRRCPDCDAILVTELPSEPVDLALVAVASYVQVHQAHEARLLLEACGIEAAVLDDTIGRTSAIAAMFGGVRVLVRELDAPRARKILGTG